MVKEAGAVVDRATATVTGADCTFVVDVIADVPTPNPWRMDMSEIVYPPEWPNAHGVVPVTWSDCLGYDLSECNGDTLLDFWTEDAVRRVQAREGVVDGARYGTGVAATVMTAIGELGEGCLDFLRLLFLFRAGRR